MKVTAMFDDGIQEYEVVKRNIEIGDIIHIMTKSLIAANPLVLIEAKNPDGNVSGKVLNFYSVLEKGK